MAKASLEIFGAAVDQVYLVSTCPFAASCGFGFDGAISVVTEVPALRGDGFQTPHLTLVNGETLP